MAIPHKTRTAFVLACVFWLSGCVPETSPPPAPGTGLLGGAGGNDRVVVSTDGSLGGGVFDSRTPADAKAMADVAEMRRDAGRGDATVEAGVMMAQRNCDLVMQNCPKQAACYPAGLGGSKCEVSMLYNVTPALCAQDAECAPGYFCGGVLRDNRVCVLICDRNFLCGGKDSCVPINGYNDVGYCRPS